MKFQKFNEIIHCCLTRFRNKKYGFFIIFIDENHFKKGKYGTEPV